MKKKKLNAEARGHRQENQTEIFLHFRFRSTSSGSFENPSYRPLNCNRPLPFTHAAASSKRYCRKIRIRFKFYHDRRKNSKNSNFVAGVVLTREGMLAKKIDKETRPSDETFTVSSWVVPNPLFWKEIQVTSSSFFLTPQSVAHDIKRAKKEPN